MEIKEYADKVLAAVKKDPSLLKKLEAEPAKTLEGILGIDLPDDQVNEIASKIKGGNLLEKASNAMKMVKDLK